jgi:hypothetical protein
VTKQKRVTKRYLVVSRHSAGYTRAKITGPRGVSSELMYYGEHSNWKVYVFHLQTVLALPEIPADEIPSPKLQQVRALRKMYETEPKEPQ